MRSLQMFFFFYRLVVHAFADQHLHDYDGFKFTVVVVVLVKLFRFFSCTEKLKYCEYCCPALSVSRFVSEKITRFPNACVKSHNGFAALANRDGVILSCMMTRAKTKDCNQHGKTKTKRPHHNTSP